MIVLVDTTIWSLALRRRPQDLNPREKALLDHWVRLVRDGRAVLVGPIRQEILSGIRHAGAFEAIREQLGHFRYLQIDPSDYDLAARFFNTCRAKGIAGTPIDLLLCAVAHRCRAPIFTTDRDFERYAPHTGVHLYVPSDNP